MAQNRFRIFCVVMLFVLYVTQSASAQATRTWVSGVGDDANPGSRTAPCKTFAGAISKTAAGGEIDALDPGGFGAVTITKAITIDGATFASILGSGTNGIVVNAGPNDVVTIRHLSINGGGTGLNGIRFIAGAELHIEDCVIFNFSQIGVDFEPSGVSRLYISDTVIRNNSGVNGGAVFLQPAGVGTVAAFMDNVRMNGNRFGIRARIGAKVTVRNSTISGSATNGVVTLNPTSPISMFLENCVITNNETNGISSNGALSVIRISNNTIVQNNVGLNSSNGGQIVSFNNNRVAGNTTDGDPTSIIPLK